MALKPFLIAPINGGLINNLEPWLLPEDAFSVLNNAYVWRGRVRKRFGTALLGDTDLLSRLRIDLGNTDASGNLALTNIPGIQLEVGMMFSCGTNIFTVTVVPTVGLTSPTLSTTSPSTGTVEFTSTPPNLYKFSIGGSDGTIASTAVYFYPATPVMGLRQRELGTINVEETVGFDTQFSYIRSGGGWERLDTASTGIWTGSDSDFFWSVNYRGVNLYETALYVVNGVQADGIRFLPQGSTAWTPINPQTTVLATFKLNSGKIIIGFKNRLIVLNTLETVAGLPRQFKNRARWSINGDPTVEATSWRSDIRGQGGYNDATTTEAIVTCEFIKDHLIVYFERSTWELVYTANKGLPFVWQKINSELGAESRFSVIGFDKEALGVGNVGVHACNGTNVERIDQKIPDEVFKIHNGNDGPKRVYGIRDYYNELVYWTFPSATHNPTYPNRVLVYNYQNKSWAFTDDSFTCFGYFQEDSDLTWASVGRIYGTWEKWNTPWGSATNQSQFANILTGNQQGFTHLIKPGRSSNSQSLYITAMTPATSTITCPNHNLQTGDYILIEDSQGVTDLNGIVVRVSGPIGGVDSFPIDTSFTGTYTGGGKITTVSNIDIRSVQFNPGTPTGLQFAMPYIDLLLDKTEEGEVSVDYLIDSTIGWTIQSQIENQEAGNGEPTVLLGNNILFTKPETNSTYQTQQERIWHRYYVQTEGRMIQLKLYMSDSQMRNLSISNSNFQLNGIILYVEPTGRIIG